jgi:hypothetical protein
VVSLADARRYGLTTAALQTKSMQDPTTKFTDGNGRTFVLPTEAALGSAASLLERDESSGTWALPYDALPKNASAYPGFMLVYADVPTSGLNAADANAYSQMLSYIAGAGQVSGPGVGQLPAGYLPLTAANGLGALAAYTRLAAVDVARQGAAAPAGAVPPVQQASPGAPSSSAGSQRSTAAAAGGSAAPVAPAKSGTAAPIATPALKSLGNTVGQTTSAAKTLLILLIALLLLGPIGAPILVLALRVRARR